MRALFLLLLLIGGTITFVQAQTNHSTWGLKYELIKPNGTVDSCAYFLITLENKTDTTLVFLASNIPHRERYYRIEFLLKDGKTSFSNPFKIFYDNGKKATLLEPRGKLYQKASFINFGGINEYDNGAFVSINHYYKVAKIRLRLENFLYHKKGVAYIGRIPLLVSDWIDVTGSDFEATMQEFLKKRKILNE